MAPSEFLSALRQAQQGQRVFETTPSTLNLVLAEGECPVQVALDGRPHKLAGDLDLLIEQAGIPPEYAAKLQAWGEHALLIACILRGLRGAAGKARLLAQDGAARFIRPRGFLLSAEQVFGAVTDMAQRYGFDPVQLLASPTGGSALYCRAAGLQVDGLGMVQPAIRIRYSTLSQAPSAPVAVHGFVLQGQDRFIGQALVGVRKYKYLRDVNRELGSLVGLLELEDPALLEQPLQQYLEHAFAIDIRSVYAQELEQAGARVIPEDCNKAELFASLLGPEYSKAAQASAERMGPAKTQLGMAFQACGQDYAVTNAPIAIMLTPEEKWNKAVARFSTAPLAAAAQ